MLHTVLVKVTVRGRSLVAQITFAEKPVVTALIITNVVQTKSAVMMAIVNYRVRFGPVVLLQAL